MKHIVTEVEERKKRLADAISFMPRKILQLHGRDNVAEFVLHELGKKDNFNLARAAYIIDNPDFNCMKGVAGFSNQEVYSGSHEIWSEPEEFTRHMANSAFNNKVRGYATPSCKKKGCNDEQTVEQVSLDLGFSHPKWYSWDMKYDNHGLLVYEKAEEDSCDCDYLLDGLCLIGFCPVF
jgi:hypothetical protein